MIKWQLTFYVSASSDFETRYAEVLAAHPVPPGSETDVAMAHDMAAWFISHRSIIPPMNVAIGGWWDSDNINTSVTTTVSQA